MCSSEACRDHLLVFLSLGSMCGWWHCREISRITWHRWALDHHTLGFTFICFILQMILWHLTVFVSWAHLNHLALLETELIIITFAFFFFSRRLVTFEWGMLQLVWAMSGTQKYWGPATDKCAWTEIKLWAQIPIFFSCSIVHKIVNGNEILIVPCLLIIISPLVYEKSTSYWFYFRRLLLFIVVFIF